MKRINVLKGNLNNLRNGCHKNLSYYFPNKIFVNPNQIQNLKYF